MPNSVQNTSEQQTNKSTSSSSHRLGQIAPVWVPDHRVTMCQLCMQPFNLMNRRHHCRCCGQVVCNECSLNKRPLKYLRNKQERVCDECNDKFEDNNNNSTLSRSSVSVRIESPAIDVTDQSAVQSTEEANGNSIEVTRKSRNNSMVDLLEPSLQERGTLSRVSTRARKVPEFKKVFSLHVFIHF